MNIKESFHRTFLNETKTKLLSFSSLILTLTTTTPTILIKNLSFNSHSTAFLSLIHSTLRTSPFVSSFPSYIHHIVNSHSNPFHFFFRHSTSHLHLFQQSSSLISLHSTSLSLHSNNYHSFPRLLLYKRDKLFIFLNHKCSTILSLSPPINSFLHHPEFFTSIHISTPLSLTLIPISNSLLLIIQTIPTTLFSSLQSTLNIQSLTPMAFTTIRLLPFSISPSFSHSLPFFLTDTHPSRPQQQSDHR